MSTLTRGLTLTAAAFVCACASGGTMAPQAFVLPDSTLLMDGATGRPLASGDLLRRIGEAEVVLLGEVHDNPIDHRLRGQLVTALAARHPAVVFEQFADGDAPLAPPAEGQAIEAWLDASGFDRTGWRWPLHRPVVDAALAHARSLWGSNLSREALRSVVREGAQAAPAPLRELMAQAPLEGAAREALDAELVASHCGQLSANMVAGMRAAQEARDAAMVRALLHARADGAGPAWLIAGNGHVRREIGVPRLLDVAAPGAHVLVVGMLEREPDGSLPAAAERRRYDVVVVTPRTPREDPCAGM